jgi:uncharacterized protein YaiI (UPF0178 family)
MHRTSANDVHVCGDISISKAILRKGGKAVMVKFGAVLWK